MTDWSLFTPVEDSAGASVDWSLFSPAEDGLPAEVNTLEGPLGVTPSGQESSPSFVATDPTPRSVLDNQPARPAEFAFKKASAASAALDDPRANAPSVKAGSAQKANPNVLRGEQFADSILPVRAAIKAATGGAEGIGGVVRAAGDLTGMSNVSQFGAAAAEGASAFNRGMGENGPISGFGGKSPLPYLSDMAEGAGASMAQMALLGGATGPKAALWAIGLQTAGQEYDQARNQGLDPYTALEGAIPKGLFEVAGEKLIGVDKVLASLGTLLNKGATEQAKRSAGQALLSAGIRELPGEEFTYLGQTATDLIPGIGLKQDLTMGEFLDGMRDTAVQASMMGGAMGGGGAILTSAGKPQPKPIPTAGDMLAQRFGEPVSQPKPDPIPEILSAPDVDTAIAKAQDAVSSSRAVDAIERILQTPEAANVSNPVGVDGTVPAGAPGGDIDIGGSELVGGLGDSGPGATLDAGQAGAAPVAVDGESAIAPAVDERLIPLSKRAPVTPQGEPSATWFGRRGDGYLTQGDAMMAIPSRQRVAPDLNWQVETMPSGKFRLAGYAAPVVKSADGNLGATDQIGDRLSERGAAVPAGIGERGAVLRDAPVPAVDMDGAGGARAVSAPAATSAVVQDASAQPQEAQAPTTNAAPEVRAGVASNAPIGGAEFGASTQSVVQDSTLPAVNRTDDQVPANPAVPVAPQTPLPSGVLTSAANKPETISAFPPTERERIEAMPAAAKKQRELAANPFKTFLIRNGIALRLARDFAPGTRERLSMGRTFRNDGMELDQLAERAAEQGYIRDRMDTDELYSLITKVASGERVAPLYGQDAEAEMAARVDRVRELEQDAESDVAELSDASLFELADDDGIPWGAEASNVTEAEAMRSLGFTDQEIEDATAERTKRAQETGAGRGQPIEAAGREAQADRAGGNEEARAGSEGLTRQASTPEELATARADLADLRKQRLVTRASKRTDIDARIARLEAAIGEIELVSPTEADILAQQAQKEAEQQRKDDKPAPAKSPSRDQIDLLNPQGGIFDGKTGEGSDSAMTAMVEKRKEAPGTMFSRASELDDPQTGVAAVLLELGKLDSLYQYPRSDKKSMLDIADDKQAQVSDVDRNAADNDLWMVANTTPKDGDGVKSWTVSIPKDGKPQRHATITEDNGKVYINVSAVGEGGGGSLAYDLAANYAKNNGLVFIGDPNGVSNAAMRRRLENMLSAAVKYGSTDFLAPHPDQIVGARNIGVPPLKWTDGDTLGNIRAMVEASVESTESTNALATANLRFDAATQSFRDAEDNRVDAGRMAQHLSGLREFEPRVSGVGAAGDTTLQRNALFRALLSGADARRSVLESVRREQGGAGSGLGEATRGIFYSRSGPDDSGYSAVNDPTEAEAQAVQSGVEGKSAVEAAKFIADNAPDESHRLIAAKVATRLRQLELLGSNFNLHVAHVGADVPATMVGAGIRGQVIQKDGDPQTHIWIQGADVTGRVGVSYEIVLHELVHAATQKAIDLGEHGAKGEIGIAARELDSVWRAILLSIQKNARAGTLTDFERQFGKGRNNAIANRHELVAWALTNKEAQAFLESVPYQNASAWSAFVAAIRRFLGLGSSADTALSEVLHVADKLLSLDAGYLMQEAIRQGVHMSVNVAGARTVVNSSRSQMTGQPLPTTSPELSPWRDGTGRLQFAPGAWLAEKIGAGASPFLNLKYVQMKQQSPAMAKLMNRMKLDIQKAHDTASAVAKEAVKLSAAEREMVSDIIDRELATGEIPPEHAVRLAAVMSAVMDNQAQDAVSLGMFSEHTAEKWKGRYLPRFYESKLRPKDESVWAKSLRGLTRKPSPMRGIKGGHFIGRGVRETVQAEQVQDYLDLGWEIEDPDYSPDSTTVQMWREHSKEKRQEWGEVKDSAFRFVMGYIETQKDIAMGRMFKTISELPEMSAADKSDEFPVHVPDTSIENTGVKRYGMLAGRWVSQETMSHLSRTEDMHNEAMRMYREAMSLWKQGKTSLNPVAHANNMMSNLTAAHYAGVSYWDVPSYLGALRDFVRKTDGVKEAREAGLFLGSMSESELLNILPENLRIMAQQQDPAWKRYLYKNDYLSAFSALTFFLRKPMGVAYQAEDTFFRYLIYKFATDRGLPAEDAVEYAKKYIFAYDDLPKGARVIRDFGIPFFAYTYKAAPMLLHTAMTHPIRFFTPAALLYGVNAISYAFAAGGDDDDWQEVLQKYLTDPEFRKLADDKERLERKLLPSWLQGSTALLTPRAIRLGYDKVVNAPLFMDISRIIPGGDMFDVSPNAGGVPWLQPLTPSHPILTSFVGLWANKDLYFGKELVSPKGDDSTEKFEKRAAWIWRQLSPAIAIGNTHWERTMNALAQANGGEVKWLPDWVSEKYTGTGRDGFPVQPGLAAMQTFGIKVRPYDLDVAEDIQEWDKKSILREIDRELTRMKRWNRKGAVSDKVYDKAFDKARQKEDFIKEDKTIDGDEKD